MSYKIQKLKNSLAVYLNMRLARKLGWKRGDKISQRISGKKIILEKEDD